MNQGAPLRYPAGNLRTSPRCLQYGGDDERERVEAMGKGNRETAALRSLRSEMQKVLQYLEVVDASLALANRTAANAKNKNSPLLKALGVKGKYDTLHLPAKQHQQVVNFARGFNFELEIRNLYHLFLEYVRSVLLPIHKKRPLELVREAAVDLSPEEVAGAIDEEALRQLHFRHALRHLEVRGEVALLLDHLTEDLDLSLDERLRREALQYLEMRNLFLYEGGEVSESFAREYGKELGVHPGGKLPKNSKLGRKAAHAIESLCVEIDRQLLGKRLLKAS